MAPEAHDDLSIVEYLRGLQASGESLRGVCIVTRTRRARDTIAAALTEACVTQMRLDDHKVDRPDEPGVRMAIMHRVKGLEFDRVVIASANEGLDPLSYAWTSRTRNTAPWRQEDS